MRRVNFLINEIRRSTNNRDVNSKTDFDMANYLNRAQRAIQKIILNSHSDSLIFAGEEDYVLVNNQRKYDLPDDIFAQNSITAVMLSTDNFNWSPLRMITPKEFRTNYGYYVADKELFLIPTPTTGSGNFMRIHYTRKLRNLAKRAGKVSSSISGTSVTIPATGDIDLSDQSDFFCVVDRNGIVKEEGLILDSYTPATGVILTSSAFTNITTDDYVIVGERTTTHSEMPEACEDYLIKHVERSIFHQDSSTDVKAQELFTAEERSDLIELFSQNNRDVSYPPITDTTYVGV